MDNPVDIKKVDEFAKDFEPVTLGKLEEARVAQINTNGSQTRAQVLLEVIEISEFKTREYNPAFMLMQYFGYLRRDPDEGGYYFWLDVLNNRAPKQFPRHGLRVPYFR